MKPVDQTVFGFPDGNCFSACVASLLELPLDEVPMFMDPDDPNGPGWFQSFTDWLRPRGFYPLFFDYNSWTPAGLCVLGGLSPRAKAEGKDYLHAVVACGGEIVHDPHPSRDGVLTRVDYTLLVPLDPAGRGERG